MVALTCWLLDFDQEKKMEQGWVLSPYYLCTKYLGAYNMLISSNVGLNYGEVCLKSLYEIYLISFTFINRLLSCSNDLFRDEPYISDHNLRKTHFSFYPRRRGGNWMSTFLPVSFVTAVLNPNVTYHPFLYSNFDCNLKCMHHYNSSADQAASLFHSSDFIFIFLLSKAKSTVSI